MRILAIDPGTTQSAYALLDAEYQVLSADKVENGVMMDIIASTPGIDAVIIEDMEPRYPRNGKDSNAAGAIVGASTYTTLKWMGKFDLTAQDEDGNVLNNVVHLVTRFSDDPKQNITLVKLLETTLTINPDCVAVAEMKGAESMQAINAANTGHSVITTIHANSCADSSALGTPSADISAPAENA